MSDPLARLKSVLEVVTGVSLLLAVVGYMSLRASLNHLGITGIANFPAELYLFEAYVIIVATVAVLAIPAAAALALAAAVLLVRRSWHIGTLFEPALPSRWADILAAGVAAFAPVLAMALWWTMQPGAEDTNVLLQPAAALGARPRRPEMFILPVLATLILAALCASRSVASRARKVLGARLAGLARAGCGAGALIMLWCAIVTFNVHVRVLQFPLAAATTKEGTGVVACGLLVLSTNEVHVIWRPGHGQREDRGRFEHLRLSELLKVAVGERVGVNDAALGSRLQSHCEPARGKGDDRQA